MRKASLRGIRTETKTCETCGKEYGPTSGIRYDRPGGRVIYHYNNFRRSRSCSKACAGLARIARGGLPPTFEVDPIEIAWAAGLYEGEGCCFLTPASPGHPSGQPHLVISMTDLEPLLRFQRVFGGVGRIEGPLIDKRRPDVAKPIWRWSIKQWKACQQILHYLVPHLSPRRIEQARPILEFTWEVKRSA